MAKRPWANPWPFHPPDPLTSDPEWPSLVPPPPSTLTAEQPTDPWDSPNPAANDGQREGRHVKIRPPLHLSLSPSPLLPPPPPSSPPLLPQVLWFLHLDADKNKDGGKRCMILLWHGCYCGLQKKGILQKHKYQIHAWFSEHLKKKEKKNRNAFWFCSLASFFCPGLPDQSRGHEWVQRNLMGGKSGGQHLDHNIWTTVPLVYRPQQDLLWPLTFWDSKKQYSWSRELACLCARSLFTSRCSFWTVVWIQGLIWMFKICN